MVGVNSGEGEDSYDVLVAVRLYFMAIAPGRASPLMDAATKVFTFHFLGLCISAFEISSTFYGY
jgi:hypothetical protein